MKIRDGYEIIIEDKECSTKAQRDIPDAKGDLLYLWVLESMQNRLCSFLIYPSILVTFFAFFLNLEWGKMFLQNRIQHLLSFLNQREGKERKNSHHLSKDAVQSFVSPHRSKFQWASK